MDSETSPETQIIATNHLAQQLSKVLFENNDEFGRILSEFCTTNAQSFSFPDLSVEDKRRVSDLFVRKLQSSQPPPLIHKLCLSSLRILSRDTNGIREFENDDMFNALRYHARLQMRPESKSLVQYPVEAQLIDNVLEAQKVIFNLIFNSSSFRSLCTEGDFLDCLLTRMSQYKTELSRMTHAVKSFDTRMLFLLTARCERARTKGRVEFGGVEILIDVISQLMQPEGAMFGGSSTLSENDCDLCVEILKSLYTLTMDWSDCSTYEEDPHAKEVFLKATPTIIDLLRSRCAVKERTYEMKSQVVNLMTNYPVTLYGSLVPFRDSTVSGDPEKNGCSASVTLKCKGPSMTGQKEKSIYQDHDMTVVIEILDFLNNRLDLFAPPPLTSSSKQSPPKPPGGLKETLTPVLCLLQNMARYNRYIRRYLKTSILPPLEAKSTRNFTQLPEEGRLLRNKLVRLMTSPISEVKEIVAELVFVICKESVARMIKYTGYGNAAGLLARKGLMGGPTLLKQNVDPDYSEDSEDSDTEEYKAIKDDINPVTGRVEKYKGNPLDEMSDEQKEYEALELAKLLGRICHNGVISPAVIDEEGRPVRVEHVMQLADMADANNNNDDSDSDGDA